MNIQLRSLAWSNMFSYGAGNQLNLERAKISQLSGVNGNGKTSISLILQELLYSKNIKGIKKSDILNRHTTARGWSGQLSFKVDKDLYDLTVERVGDSSKVKLLKNGQDISEHKIPDTYKKLHTILGMTFEVFSQLTYQSSTDLLDFIKATDTNRKKFLINLFGLEKYLEIGDVLKIKMTDVEQEHATLQGELSGVKKFLESTTITDKKTLIPVPPYDTQAETKRAHLKVQLDDFNAQCIKIDKNLMLIKERDGLKFDVSVEKPSQDVTLSDKIKAADTAITLKTQKVKDLERNKSSIDTSDSCYACGQKIDNSKGVELKNQIDLEIGKLNFELTELKADLKSHREQENRESIAYRNWITNQKAIERFEQLSQLIDKSIPFVYPDYAAIKTDYDNTTKYLNDLQNSIEEANRYNNQVHIHNTRVETLVEQRRDFLARQELLENSIINLKIKINHLNILKKAFSTSGIVAFKLENLTKQLESTINYYLAELSDGQFQIIFRLNGEKLNIVVANNGKETPIETVSGGEFGRIQTSILLAIRNILSKIGGSKVNILFLDEITGVLDAAGKERLVDILMQEDANTFFISHDFEHPLIEKIQIVKQNNISKIGE
jgi:DNA repair exonuclease SbcCD ATPase subunit